MQEMLGPGAGVISPASSSPVLATTACTRTNAADPQQHMLNDLEVGMVLVEVRLQRSRAPREPGCCDGASACASAASWCIARQQAAEQAAREKKGRQLPPYNQQRKASPLAVAAVVPALAGGGVAVVSASTMYNSAVPARADSGGGR